MRYAYIEEQRQRHSVKKLCQILDVTEAGFYAWRKRPESKRSKANRILGDKVQVRFAVHKRRYGSPRIYRELRAEGELCGENRIARLMQARNLRARAARKFRVTTDSRHALPCAQNVLNRAFDPKAPDKVWAGDITYLWSDQGWLYLAVFIDLFSRRVVGWATSNRLDGSLVEAAFERAVVRRRPLPGLLIHTDRGCQYAAHDFRQLLCKNGLVLSMSRKGNCWDNAVAESFFHTLKVEAIHGETFKTRAALEGDLFDYIEHYYNSRRLHSTIDYMAPIGYEEKYKLTTETLAA